MPQLGRTSRLLLFLIVLAAPFAALFALTLLFPPPTLSSTQPAPESPFAPDASLALHPSTLPLLAAADNNTLWLLRPVLIGMGGTTPRPAFELLTRASNSADWRLLRADPTSGLPYFSGTPLALAAITDPAHATSLFLAATQGRFLSISADSQLTLATPSPPDHRLLALGSAPDAIYALTLGPPHPSTTRPGDRLLLQPLLPEKLPDPTHQLITPPATTTSPLLTTLPGPASAPSPLINLYAFQGSSWIALPSLGPPNTPDSPSPDARIALTAADSHLAIAWVEPARPADLLLRSRPLASPAAPWSPILHVPLEEPLPPDARLTGLTLNAAACILYPVPTGKSFALLGQKWSYSPDNLPHPQRLPTMPLGPLPDNPPANINPARDLALATSENSLIAILALPPDPSAPASPASLPTLETATFDSHGQRIADLHPIAPATHPIGFQLGENIVLLIVASLMILSLWRWKNHPRQTHLPFGKQSAPLITRAAAFLIDFALAFVAVITAAGLWENNAYLDLLLTWINALTRPQLLLDNPPILYILALYTAHVSIGELFFRKSIGKALLGTQVLMVDGKAPTVAAVLIRNFVRLAELIAAGIPLFYMCISPYRQRPGDVLAQTVIIKDRNPTPPPG